MSTQDPTPPSADRPYGDPPEAPRFGQSGASGEPPAAPSGGQPPYGQPPAGQDPYGQPAPYAGGAAPYGGGYGGEQPRNGIGVAALVVGIASLLLAIIPFVGFIGVAAVILGIVGLSRVRKRLATNRGMAIAGIVLGALAVLAAIAWVVGTIFLVGVAGPALEQCSQFEPGSIEQQQCIEDNLLEQQ